MSVNEAYFVAPQATVTLNNIPLKTPGLYDKFPWLHDETYSGIIRWFPGPFLMIYLYFNTD